MLMAIPLEVVTILSNKVEPGLENYEITLLSGFLLESRVQTIAMDFLRLIFFTITLIKLNTFLYNTKVSDSLPDDS